MAVGVGASPGMLAQDSTVCSELMPVVGHARTQFRALRGDARRALLEGDRRFNAARPLPGAAECVITQVNADWSEYECTWYLSDPDDLERQYSAFTGAVRTCFADFDVSDEPERLSPGGDNRIRPASVRVKISDAVEIAVRKWTSGTTSGRTRIDLTVYHMPRER